MFSSLTAKILSALIVFSLLMCFVSFSHLSYFLTFLASGRLIP